MRVLVTDRQTYRLSSRTITDEGFLSAPARVARTGIQQYLASELGLADRQPNDLINVYRPADEVFNADSLDTYKLKDLANDHPATMVSADNYRQVTVGQVVSAGAQDGDYVKVDILIKDKSAIDKVNAGKAELSAGYYADYIAEQGTTDGGQDYEFVQRNIVINHVALVDKARAGSGAKIFDNQGGRKMAIITLDNKRTAEVDDAVAPLIEDSIQRLTDKAETAASSLEAKDAELTAATAKVDKLTEDNETLQAQTTDEAINARVAEALSVHDTARKLLPEIEIGDKSIDAIKREVCVALHPGRDFKDKDMTYINATFDMDKEEMEKNDEKDKDDKKKATDSIAALGKDLSGQTQSAFTDAQSVRQAQLGGAWNKGE